MPRTMPPAMPRTIPPARAKTLALPRKPKPGKPEVWQLRLYVAGQTPKSVLALANLKALCEGHLKGHYRIEVIDLLEHPQMARGNQIIAVPTLIRKLAHPVRKIVGDLSNTDRVLIGLALHQVA